MTRLLLASALLVCSQAHAQFDCGGDANNRLIAAGGPALLGIWFRGDIAGLSQSPKNCRAGDLKSACCRSGLAASDDRANVLSAQVADASGVSQAGCNRRARR